MTIFGISIDSWAHIATIIGVLVAASAFAVDVRSRIRQRSIDNCIRYIQFHDRLFTNESYLKENVTAIEEGNLKRDESDEKMEERFRVMLSDFESLALLHKSGGAPKSINAYMLGFFAKEAYKVLNDREKAEPYWELAIDFITETKKAAEELDNIDRKQRLEYMTKNHF